jgi:hypothetical protein
MLDRIRAAGSEAWLKLVHRIHNSAGSLCVAIAAAYEAKPDAVKALLNAIPLWAYLVCAVPLYLLIGHALKRAKTGS